MMAGPVVFSCNEVVGNDVVESGIGVEPSGAVEGDPAGPAVIAGYCGSRRHVSVVMDGVVIGGEVIAIDGGEPGTTRGGDVVGDKTQVMGSAQESDVGAVACS